MSDSRSNFESFRVMYLEAAAWLDSLGIDVSRTRFAQYAAQLDYVLANPEMEARTDHPAFAKVLEAFESAGELLVIRCDLARFDSVELRRRLASCVSGPYLQSEEDPGASSNHARNLGFELVFAAQLVTAKFTPVLSEEGDLRTEFPDIAFECKRPQGANKLERALRDARKQLECGDRSGDVCKVIAVSVGKVLHGGQAVLHGGDQHEVHEQLRSKLDGLIAMHEHVWRAPSFDNVAGIWLHYSSAAFFTRLNALVRASYNRVIVRPNVARPEWGAAVGILSTELNKNLEFGPF